MFRVLSKIQNPLIPVKFPIFQRSYSASSLTKVTVVGAATSTAKSLALMLKQSPFIDELCLYDRNPLHGFVQDLNFVDTQCKVYSYEGPKDIKKALSASSVVVITATSPQCDSPLLISLDKNGHIVKEIAINIANCCPKAMVAVATEPLNSMVPMVSEVLKRNGHYNSAGVFGVTTLDVVRANKFVAEVQGVEPECVVVPVIGGHTDKTIIPVLSQAQPCSEFTDDELEDITKSVREAHKNLEKTKSCDTIHLSAAFAIARFVISLVKALRGQPEIVECAYVKSTVHPQLKYMSTPLQLGPSGIMRNLGMPELSDYERCLFDNAIPFLVEDIKRGEVFGGKKDKPVCDVCDPNPKAPKCPPDHCAISSLMRREP